MTEKKSTQAPVKRTKEKRGKHTTESNVNETHQQLATQGQSMRMCQDVDCAGQLEAPSSQNKTGGEEWGRK